MKALSFYIENDDGLIRKKKIHSSALLIQNISEFDVLFSLVARRFREIIRIMS